VGIKNYEQILYSMSSVTGVPYTNTGIQNVYKKITLQMSSDNDLKSFLPANQVAITTLAGEFCNGLVENPSYRVLVWPTINFGQTPTQVFNAANKKIIIDTAISKFMPPLDSATQELTYDELSTLFDEILIDENLASAVTTKNVTKVMCISILSSAHATLL
jgi:hypothetical protein